MVVYTLEQRLEILRHYFENHGNVAEYVRKLRTDFGKREACDRLTEDADFAKKNHLFR